MALKGKWALKWVMLSVPILVKLEFFQHPREDVIEVVVCTTAVIIILVQFSDLPKKRHQIVEISVILKFNNQKNSSPNVRQYIHCIRSFFFEVCFHA